MKKLATLLFVVTCFLVLLVVTLMVIAKGRQNELREQSPLAMAELDRMVAELEREPGNSQLPAAAEPASAGPPVQEPAKQLPRRLNRVLTDAERRELFSPQGRPNEWARAFCNVSLCGLGCDLYCAAKGDPTITWMYRGSMALEACDWAEARNCFSEYARRGEENGIRCDAALHLAYLEGDPGMALKYMDLVCSSGIPGLIGDCAKLARKTGSTELAEHYEALYEKAKREWKPPDEQNH